jgi:hypothetical protein
MLSIPFMAVTIKELTISIYLTISCELYAASAINDSVCMNDDGWGEPWTGWAVAYFKHYPNI